jgi:alpha,alpha-trehalose phosphorylase
MAMPLVYRGRRLYIEVLPDEARYSLDPGDAPLDVLHWGERITVSGSVARPIPPAPELTPPGQPAGRAPARRRR